MKLKILEQYELAKGYYRPCCKAIHLGLSELGYVQKTTRGNGAVVSILASLYEYITGNKIDPKDYILHHINGVHDDNRIDNVALFKTTLSHTSFHSNIIKEVAYKFANIQNIPKDQKITADLFANVDSSTLKLLAQLYMRTCEESTHNIGQNGNDDVIFITKLI